MHPSSLLSVVFCAALLGAGACDAPESKLGGRDPDSAGPQSTGGVPPRSTSPFVPNLGQWSHSARYVHRSGPVTMFLEDRGWVLDLPAQAGGVAVRMTFEGDPRVSELEGEGKLRGVHNYFLGNDDTRWRTHVPLFTSVCYRGVYPGIDVRVREAEGHPEYDLLLAPDADLERVALRVEGALGLDLASDGSLVIETGLGQVTQPVPITWEHGADGERRIVACRYVLLDADRFGFAVAGRDPDRPLTIDPGLIWSTMLGASVRSTQSTLDIAIDSSGDVILAGAGLSNNYFPTTLGAYQTLYGGGFSDAVVSRLDPSQTGSEQLVYSTYIGGTDRDHAWAVSVDTSGVVTIAGHSASSGFPTTPGAYDRTLNGKTDVVVCRLDPDLPGPAQILYSTFVGGGDWENPTAMAVSATGSITVTGRTLSPTFPTTPGAYNRTFIPGAGWDNDAFVFRLDPSLLASSQLTYSTLLGTGDDERACALWVDEAGVITVTGYTDSATFPTTPGAYDTDGGCFVSRLDPSRSGSAQLVYSTTLGTVGFSHGISVATDGVITIAGTAMWPGFPTTPGAYDRTYTGTYFSGDAFVSQLDPRKAGTEQLVYSTYLGEAGEDHAHDVFVDASGIVTVTGQAGSADFPSTTGTRNTIPGDTNAFISRLDPSVPGSAQLLYSTIIGGTGHDKGTALCVDADGTVTLAGETWARDFPTTRGAFSTKSHGSDIFVCRLDMLPVVSTFGASSPGCNGPIAIATTSYPHIGNPAFSIDCSNAPAIAAGLAVLGDAPRTTPLLVFGAGMWVHSTGPSITRPLMSDAAGTATLPLPIPQNPWLIGMDVYAQFFWATPTAPAPCPPLGVASSNALRITCQP